MLRHGALPPDTCCSVGEPFLGFVTLVSLKLRDGAFPWCDWVYLHAHQPGSQHQASGYLLHCSFLTQGLFTESEAQWLG